MAVSNFNIDLDKYSNIISDNNGVLTVNDNSIAHNTVLAKETSDLYLVHATDYFPNNRMILSNVDGHKKVPFQYEIDENIFVIKESLSPRETVHFCINGKVEDTSLGEGKWDEPKFIVIEPYAGHENEFVSGPMHGGDNFTNNSVKLSDNAILVVREDVLKTLTDEQKDMYNIVAYRGNSNECIDNLFTAMGVPKINNFADDRTHFLSEQYDQERVLEKRAQAVKLLKNMDISHSNNNYNFTTDDIVALSKLGTTLNDLNQETVSKLKQELNLDSDYLAEFIISNGIVKTGTNDYCLLSTKELCSHLNDPDFYIDAVKKSGTGLEELNEKVNNTTIEDYQNSSKLESNYQFKDISVGKLQSLQNFASITHLRDSLNIDKDKVLILREDGIYLSDQIVEGVYSGVLYQNYKQKNESEQLLGNNADTMLNVRYNYNNLKGIKDYNNSISQQADAMVEAMANGTMDTNGNPILSNQEQAINGRQMGFVKVWVLGILAMLVSFGIIILSIVINQ